MKTISSAESDLVLSARRTLSAHRYKAGGWPTKRIPDNAGSRYNTYFSGHLSGFASRKKGRSPSEKSVFISAPRNNMSPIAIGPLLVLSVCILGNHCAIPQSEIPHAIRWRYLRAKRQSSLCISITDSCRIMIIEDNNSKYIFTYI